MNPPIPFRRTGAHSSNRESWLRERSRGIGASEAAALMGESPWETPADLWAAKLVHAPRDLGECAEWGLRLEDAIASAYSEPRYSGREVVSDCEIIVSTEHPWALATLDAWTDHHELGRIPLELKTTSAYSADEWAAGVPRHYWWQCQHQALVTGAPMVAVACLIGGQQLVWDDVTRDDDAIARLINRGRRFWDAVVSARESGEVAPPEWVELTSEAARKLWPSPDADDAVDLPLKLVDVDMELRIVKARMAADKLLKDELEERLKVAIGKHGVGRLPSGVVYSWTEQHKRGYTVEPSSTRVLRRKAPKGVE